MGQALLILVGGLVLLVGGGDVMVRGASALARAFGVSPLVIGLTVVAFGTSAPELAVNVTAALSGVGELSFGNVVGSNIANVGLVVGVTGMVRVLSIHTSLLRREIPMMLLGSLATLVIGLTTDRFAGREAAILLSLFAVFLYYTIRDALRQRSEHRPEGGATGQDAGRGRVILVSLLFIAAGLTGLILGGRVTVGAATEIARELGLSEAVIGLTIVAVGTSLPELVTGLIAVLRGETDLAVGNVVGSNIFNLMFVLGTTAAVSPVPIPLGGRYDLIVMVGLSAVLYPLTFNRERTIGRIAALALFATYAAYIAWRAMG